ncbi:MAG: hypothetical protein JSS09_09485 [Verrucomicrobia bacterium]|nr:hypothetical protein [Verrucomicrobiota bacterium]
MKESIILQENNHPSNAFNNALEETLREGARKLLQQAIEHQVNEYLENWENLRRDNNKNFFHLKDHNLRHCQMLCFKA